MSNIDLPVAFEAIQKNVTVISEALNPEVYALEQEPTVRRLLCDPEIESFLKERINTLKNIELVRAFGESSSVDKLLMGIVLANTPRAAGVDENVSDD